MGDVYGGFSAQSLNTYLTFTFSDYGYTQAFSSYAVFGSWATSDVNNQQISIQELGAYPSSISTCSSVGTYTLTFSLDCFRVVWSVNSDSNCPNRSSTLNGINLYLAGAASLTPALLVALLCALFALFF